MTMTKHREVCCTNYKTNEIFIFLMLLKIPVSIKLQEIFFLLFWATTELKYKMVY